MGLVLEWVYGTIVSTAEKSRDGAKRPLGEPLEYIHLCSRFPPSVWVYMYMTNPPASPFHCRSLFCFSGLRTGEVYLFVIVLSNDRFCCRLDSLSSQLALVQTANPNAPLDPMVKSLLRS